MPTDAIPQLKPVPPPVEKINIVVDGRKVEVPKLMPD